MNRRPNTPSNNQNLPDKEFRIDLVFILPSKDYTINNFTIQYIYNYQSKFQITDSEAVSRLPYITVTVHQVAAIFHYEIQSFDKEGNLYNLAPENYVYLSGTFPSDINPLNFRNLLLFSTQRVFYNINHRQHIDNFTYIETSYV